MGTTVVFACDTHDLDDALRLTDNLLILQNGKVVQEGNSSISVSTPNQNM
jgi:iron(III) transport system ATP-binding protein